MLFNKLIFFFFLTCLAVSSASHRYEAVAGCEGLSPVVKKDQREVLVSTEFGQISAVNVSDGIGGHYHLQFITLEPNALFLPVVLHADMVFYIHTGSGSLSWSEVEADTTKSVDLQTGDVYGLPTGSIFYLQSGLEPERTKLRIYAMFVNSNEPAFQEQILPVGTYSSIRNLLLGFDRKVLQAAFQASDEAMEELMNAEKLPQIVHATLSKKEEKKKKGKGKGKGKENSIESRFMEVLMDSSRNYRMMLNFNEEMDNKMGKKKKKEDTFSFMNADHDFENCNGWSVAVTSKNMPSLRSPDVGLFMVNLARGAMMGPHWNPLATELGIVVHGQGMILTVSSSVGKRESCRIKVEEGDVFVVPRFSMMAQLAFNNDSLVFMGFSTSARMNHPQYSAGKASVLQVLDRKVLALSFNVTNSTMDQILNPAVESIILECGSCAEEEERIMYEEIRKEEEEAAAAARKREEEEAAAAARKREEEEAAAAARKREEEEAAAAARKREEEEAAAAARKREEEEAAAARKREEEEAAARKREEEEAAARKREEEEEAARKREEEEESRKREEEEEARKREEEEEARKRKEEEEIKREEEEARKRKEEHEAARKQEEEAARKQEEEAAKQEEEDARRQEEEQEEAARRQQEEQEEAAKRREKEKEAKREEESRRREEEEAVRREIEKKERAKRVEEEEAKQEEEEPRKREEEEEEQYDQE